MVLIRCSEKLNGAVRGDKKTVSVWVKIYFDTMRVKMYLWGVKVKSHEMVELRISPLVGMGGRWSSASSLCLLVGNFDGGSMNREKFKAAGSHSMLELGQSYTIGRTHLTRLIMAENARGR